MADTSLATLADNRVAARRLYSVVVEDMARCQNWDRSDQRMGMSRYPARSYWKFHKDPGYFLDGMNMVLDRS